MRRSRICLPFGIAAILLAATAVGAVAIDDDSNPPSGGHAQIQAIQPAAAAALAVLEGPRTAGDGLPTALAARMDRHAPFGMNPHLSRVAIGNATHSVYVIPANDHVCASLTMGEGADLSCPATADVAGGDAPPTTVSLGTGGIAIYGLVPDGVDSVSVHTAASTIGIEPERNAYYTVLPAGTALRSVGYDGPNGPATFAVHDPAEVFEGQ